LWAFEPPGHADNVYAWYVMRFWSLYQTALNALGQSDSVDSGEPTVSVKHLDYYLIWLTGTAS